MTEQKKAVVVLTLNTIAFTVCFAAWMLNGVLVTFLIENQVFNWSQSQVGWLIGIPVLSGALFRLPVGILTDKYGGQVVFTAVMLVAAVPMFFLSYANSYLSFFLLSLGFGLAGASFAVGIAYTSVWFSKAHQGTALGIFGAGNAGAALTSLGAPSLLNWLTQGGQNIEAWRTLPQVFAGGLLVMAAIFVLLSHPRKVEGATVTGLRQRLRPLRYMRVWRFGLYYFLVFGGFVALAQWLIPYYVNVYAMSIAMAGLMASVFSLPSGVIRALGGYMSDKIGARRVMYFILGITLVCCVLLIFPRMEIQSPGKGVMAKASGTVTQVTDQQIVVDGRIYPYTPDLHERMDDAEGREGAIIFPTRRSWQEPIVAVGDTVQKKQLLAQGVTHIYFQANVWIFTGLVFVIGITLGIGKAAVYKHIPDYFPNEVGVVGGIVGVLGGLGGFLCPILFGYMLERTGIWTTCWMFFSVLTFICLWWMHSTIQHMHHRASPEIKADFEHPH